jgi:CO/xanthine dehydrogenase FAD-binding subunit
MSARVIRPRTWDDAVRARADHPGAWVVAGGTGVQQVVRAGVEPPSEVIAIDRVRREPRGLALLGNGAVRLDALATVHEAFTAAALAPLWSTVDARGFATPALRRRATVVGNLMHLDGPQDLAPAMLLSGAVLEVRGVDRVRTVAVADLLGGHGPLRPDELVTGLRIVVPDGCVLERFAARRVSARTVATVGVARTGAGHRAVLVLQGRRATRVPHAEQALDDGLGTDDFCARMVQAADRMLGDAEEPPGGLRHVVVALSRRAGARLASRDGGARG